MRLRRDYRKPELPPGPFLIYEPESGLDDGPFFPEDLVQSTLPGNPWGFASGGASPTVFRIKKQQGMRIWTEEGQVIDLVPLPPEEEAAA